ncbi:MAG: cell division protein FtsQ/DivIB [Steroidobacteraceae bacterium]
MFASTPSQARPARSSAVADTRLLWLRAHRQLLMWFGLIAALLLLLWFALVSILDRPIQRAAISGKFAQVSRLQIEQALEPFAHRGFISIDLATVKQALEQIHWIDRARVERAWPDGLRVTVTEQVAVARWGTTGLLNTRGELFLPDARDLPAELPQLIGPDGMETEVAALYLDTYPRLLTVGLHLNRVTLDARGAWNLSLSNGVDVRLGRQDIKARLERFITTASPVLATRSGEVKYVDMRYSNGFSIGWGGGDKAQVGAGNNGNV